MTQILYHKYNKDRHNEYKYLNQKKNINKNVKAIICCNASACSSNYSERVLP